MTEIESNVPDRETPTFLHAASGLFILGLDWALFSGNLMSGGLSTPVVVAAGLVLGGLGTALIERFVGQGAWGPSVVKGLLAGLVVGAPFPIAGTFAGSVVLGASGLRRLQRGKLTKK